MKNKKKLSLTVQIVIGLVLGVLVGLALQGNAEFAKEYIKPFGTIYLNLIKTIVVPVVLLSIIQGIISLEDVKKVGSIGVRTVLYYMCTTALAVTIGLLFANLLNVGGGFVLPSDELSYEASQAPGFMTTLVNMFPSNIIQPLANATMLQVIVIAILFGFGIILAGEKGEVAARVVDSFAEVSFKIMGMIISLSAIGVFALICPVVAENGPAVLLPLLKVILVAYVGYICHMVLVYSLAVKGFAGMSPLTFFKGMSRPIIFAFSSASSVGTLPFNMEATQKLGARKEIASFVLPLGATINMDGTAIYQAVATVFIAACYGVTLSLSDMAMVVLTATLASVGTAGVSGAGMIMLAMVLETVGLPVEGIAIIAGVDKIFDMGRTALNITGDATCAIWISKLEQKKAAKAAAKAAK